MKYNIKDLRAMNAKQLREFADQLGIDKKKLYGTSNDAIRFSIIRFVRENNKEGGNNGK